MKRPVNVFGQIVTLVVAAGWCLCARAAAPALGSKDLTRLVTLTEEHCPLIQKAKEALHMAEMQRSNSWVSFFPSFNVDSTQGLTGQMPANRDTPWTSQFNLTLNENLMDNGASPLNNNTRWQIANVVYDKSRLEYEDQRDRALLILAQVYFEWSESVQMRKIDGNKRDLLRQQDNVVEAQYKQGLKTKRDVLRLETEVRRMEMSIMSRDNQVDLNMQRLAGAIGISLDELRKEKINPEEPAKDITVYEGAGELKAEDHRRAKILEDVEKQARLEVNLHKHDYWPQVLLKGEAGYHNHDYVDSTDPWNKNGYWDFSALLTLRYNLWDWGRRRRDVEIANVKADMIRDDNRQTLIYLANDLRNVSNKLREYRDDVRMSQELLVLEQQSYSLLEAEYRTGRTTYLDLITNLNSLIEARSKFISSYFGLRRHQVLYAYHKGELFDALH